jgi:TRAP transporter TAXI family solute receptor
MHRRRFITTGAAAAGAIAGLPFLARPARAETFINVLTGGTSGVYYPLGVALANLFNQKIPDANASAQATKASVENLNLLQGGDGELAFTLADAASQAWAGVTDAGYAGPLDRLRHVAAIYSNYIQIVATAESGIATLADLRGKRISVGAPKSGTELNARAILGAAGLAYGDFEKVEYLAFAESVDLMKNRQLDVTLQSAGLGVASIKDLATSVAIVVVPIPPETIAAVGDVSYQPGTIPAGTYEGQGSDVATAAIRNLLATHDGVPDDLVHAMVDTMYANLDTLVAAHAAAKAIVLDKSAVESPLPLHPGAERFFREKGLL